MIITADQRLAEKRGAKILIVRWRCGIPSAAGQPEKR